MNPIRHAGRILNSAVLVLVLALPAAAQRKGLPGPPARQRRAETSPVTPKATPEALAHGQQIVLAAAQAAGGDSLRSISTLEFSEKGNLYTVQGALPIHVRWQVAYPGKVHAEVTLSAATVTQISDGESAWIQSPRGTQEVAASAVGEFQRGIALFGGWGFYQQALASSVKAQYLGQEKSSDGAQADTVNWLAPFGNVKLYFDSATHLLVEAKYTSHSMHGPVESDQRWSDFRAAEDRQFPYQSVTYRGGVKYTDSTVQEIKINPPLDPSLFSKPAAPATQPPSQRR